MRNEMQSFKKSFYGTEFVISTINFFGFDVEERTSGLGRNLHCANEL